MRAPRLALLLFIFGLLPAAAKADSATAIKTLSSSTPTRLELGLFRLQMSLSQDRTLMSRGIIAHPLYWPETNRIIIAGRLVDPYTTGITQADCDNIIGSIREFLGIDPKTGKHRFANGGFEGSGLWTFFYPSDIYAKPDIAADIDSATEIAVYDHMNTTIKRCSGAPASSEIFSNLK